MTFFDIRRLQSGSVTIREESSKISDDLFPSFYELTEIALLALIALNWLEIWQSTAYNFPFNFVTVTFRHSFLSSPVHPCSASSVHCAEGGHTLNEVDVCEIKSDP